MPFYHTLGRIPRKRHIVFRSPGGALYAEQLIGNEGFTGPASLLYHIRPPTTNPDAKLYHMTLGAPCFDGYQEQEGSREWFDTYRRAIAPMPMAGD